MSMSATERIPLKEAERLCIDAALAAGASAPAAESIAKAAVAAEAEGQPTVGLAHFIDYLDALEAGRIDGTAKVPGEMPVRRRGCAAYFARSWQVAQGRGITGLGGAAPPAGMPSPRIRTRAGAEAYTDRLRASGGFLAK